MLPGAIAMGHGRRSRLTRPALHGSSRESATPARRGAEPRRARRRRRSGARSYPARAGAHDRAASSSRASRADRCGPSRTPRAVAIVCATRSGTESGARSTSQTPSAEFAHEAHDASRTASRVFPTPPAPVSDSSRDDASTPGNSRSSFRRPTKLVSSAGRL